MHDNPNRMQDQILDVLQDWKRQTNDHSVGKLLIAVENAGNNVAHCRQDILDFCAGVY